MAPDVSDLVFESVTVRGVRVPLKIELGTSADVIRSVPLVLVDVQTRCGVIGRSYVFCYTASVARAIAGHIVEAAGLVAGERIRPQILFDKLARRYALPGVTGSVRAALSAFDAALWDVLAVAAGLPLAVFLGGNLRPIPAYDSRGLGLMAPDVLTDEAETLLGSGLGAIKLRLGHPELQQDLEALNAVQRRIGEEIGLMVDYNQALTLTEALRRGRAMEGAGLLWFEEPIRHDDYRGCATIARELKVPLQIGENFNGPEAMADALALQAGDYVMPDVARIGGVTGWMRAAGIAAARGISMSSHLMPEMSVHLLAATPTAHWLEYVDWADAVLEHPLEVKDGKIAPPDRPGFGLKWSNDKLKHLEHL